MVGVRLTVLFSYQGNDMLTSMQVVAEGIAGGDDAVRESGKDGFWMSLGIFAILAVLNIAQDHARPLMTQRFMLTWRAWLTDRLTGDWLDGKAYYRARFIDDTIDNPDQRIQTDIDIFTAGVGPLPNTPNNTSGAHCCSARSISITTVISFTAILWNLSGTITHAHGRHPTAQGDVLDRDRLRPDRHGHRVLDRPADHQAVIQQREVQRGLPLCAGATA